MTLTQIKLQLEEKMVEVLVALEKKLNRTLPIPLLELKQLGRVAGRANSNTNTIHINPDYCLNGHWNEMRDTTLPHEVAHIIADFIYVNDYRDKGVMVEHRPHGVLWRYVMGLIGLPPVRCHNMDTTTVTKIRPRPFKYVCGCSTHMVGAIKHGRAQRGVYRSFRCKKCKKEVMFAGVS